MTHESQIARDARIDTNAIIAAVVSKLPRMILVSLIVLAVTFVVVSFMPKLYESSAGILVEARSNIYSRASNESASQSGGAETGAVSSQIELLKSRDTLLNVVRSENLRDVPEFNSAGGGFSPMALIGKLLGRKSTPADLDEVALANLFGRMTVIQQRDSRIISVLVRSADPELAARLANAVAKAHVARRAELSLSDTAEASDWLKAEIDKLRTSVTADENAVANFKVANDLYTGSNNSSLVDQQMSSVATQMSAAQERKNTALSRATLIRGLIDRGQPIEGVPDVRDSVVIQQLSQQKAQLQGERAQKSATLLNNHPVIQALAAQIAELDKQIGIEGRRVADALQAEAQIEEGIETSLRADLDQLKRTASTATKDTVTLDGLQREAKAQRDLLEGYLQRYSEAASRTDSQSALPDVRVVSLAAPSSTPASPKTSLILLAVGIVVSAGQIGFVIFSELMSGRAIVYREPYEPLMERHVDVDGDGEVKPQFDVTAEPEFDLAMSEYVGAGGVFADDRADLVDQDAMEASPTPDWAMADAYGDGRDTLLPPPLDDIEEHDDDVTDDNLEEAATPGTMSDVRSLIAKLDAITPKTIPAVDFEEPAEPIVTPVVELEHSRPAAPPLDHSVLSSDLVLGRTRMVVLAGKSSHKDCAELADVLTAEALDRGLSVALIDAGSGWPTAEPGIADLSNENASFGDVVQKSTDEGFAEVPWGHAKLMDRRSTKPVTLVEALSDIYEVVILMTGRVGMTSTLPMFGDIGGRLVLVTGEQYDPDELEEAREQLAESGFGNADVVMSPRRVAA